MCWKKSQIDWIIRAEWLFPYALDSAIDKTLPSWIVRVYFWKPQLSGQTFFTNQDKPAHPHHECLRRLTDSSLKRRSCHAATSIETKKSTLSYWCGETSSGHTSIFIFIYCQETLELGVLFIPPTVNDHVLFPPGTRHRYRVVNDQLFTRHEKVMMTVLPIASVA